MKTHAELAWGLLAGALTLASTSAADYQPLKLGVDRSRIGFTASTLVFSVDGMFKKYEILVDGDPSDYPAAKVRVNIDAASIFTGNSTRVTSAPTINCKILRRSPPKLKKWTRRQSAAAMVGRAVRSQWVSAAP